MHVLLFVHVHFDPDILMFVHVHYDPALTFTSDPWPQGETPAASPPFSRRLSPPIQIPYPSPILLLDLQALLHGIDSLFSARTKPGAKTKDS